jgi:hypothetical protein
MVILQEAARVNNRALPPSLDKLLRQVSTKGVIWEDVCLLGWCAVQSGRSLPMFQEVLAASIIIALMMEAPCTFWNVGKHLSD